MARALASGGVVGDGKLMVSEDSGGAFWRCGGGGPTDSWAPSGVVGDFGGGSVGGGGGGGGERGGGGGGGGGCGGRI